MVMMFGKLIWAVFSTSNYASVFSPNVKLVLIR
jgi:hypothetical protein